MSIPWEVLVLVATNLDPKTLATASSVSKQWHHLMSSDHLWELPCTAHYPSLSHLRSAAVPSLPYHRLYNLGFTSAKRRKPPPPKPRITLENLMFVITLDTGSKNSSPVTLIKRGTAFNQLTQPPQLPTDLNSAKQQHRSLFRFDFDVGDEGKWLEFDLDPDRIPGGLGEMRVTWNVVLGGFEGVFTMMDCKGKGSRLFCGSDGWFSEELPEVCGGGLVAEMRVVVRGGGGGRKVVVESVGVGVGVGVLSVVSWRYVGVEDGLRYLQHFLC